jgi:hypothetical protein
VACKAEEKCACVVGKPECKGQLLTSRRKFEDNFKIDNKEIR